MRVSPRWSLLLAPLAVLIPDAVGAARAGEAYLFEITSTDPSRAATARISLSGSGYVIGARPPGGQVTVADHSGVIVTPAVIELRGGPAVITLQADSTEPELRVDVRPASGSLRELTATGRELRIEQDGGSSGGSVRLSGEAMRAQLRPGGSE